MYLLIDSFIYLNLCIGKFAGGPIPLTNIWRELVLEIM